jgi:beta-aspartyl-peptidase (threonine type)
MWAIALHGGATEIEPEEEEAYRSGCLRALEAGRGILEGGGSAVEAVVAAVRVLEDDPTFNAGHGSARNADGVVEMCSGVMDGRDLGVGAVSIIRDVRHPVDVALALLDEPETLLAAEGAIRFASERGLAGPSAAPPRVAQESGRSHDTVGCVARDAKGHLAAATSTGGLEGSRAGRVGDTPQPGSGFYADDRMGALVLSGDGEMISRAMAASRVLHALPASGPEAALRRALDEVAALEGEVGGVLLTPEGGIASDHNSREFCVASQAEGDAEPTVTLRKAGDR